MSAELESFEWYGMTITVTRADYDRMRVAMATRMTQEEVVYWLVVVSTATEPLGALSTYAPTQLVPHVRRGLRAARHEIARGR